MRLEQFFMYHAQGRHVRPALGARQAAVAFTHSNGYKTRTVVILGMTLKQHYCNSETSPRLQMNFLGVIAWV